MSVNADQIENSELLAGLADDIQSQGYSVKSHAVPLHLADCLREELMAINSTHLQVAQMGRSGSKVLDQHARGDSTYWISSTSDAGSKWLSWTAALQAYLNRQLLLGLFAFESHFARYPAGARYTRHRDTFRDEGSRVLSLVAYLNPDWPKSAGGELVLYTPKGPVKVRPCHATLVVFLSDEFEHEVYPANRERFSIAGWFTRNASNSKRIDLPK